MSALTQDYSPKVYTKPFPKRIVASSGGVKTATTSTLDLYLGTNGRSNRNLFIVSNLDNVGDNDTLLICLPNGTPLVPVFAHQTIALETTDDLAIKANSGSINYTVCELFDDDGTALGSRQGTGGRLSTKR